MDSHSEIRDYLRPSDRSSHSSSGFVSPLRKPSEPSEEDIALKENHWIGNLSSVSQGRLEKHIESHIAQVVTISKTTHRNQWLGNDISSLRPSCLETPIGREHQSELEELQLEIRRLKTELQRRELNSRSKSKTKGRSNDESVLETVPPTTIYMKEINNKNIEITKLRESYSVLKSENETMTLIVREKESEIELLQNRLDELNRQRKQFENYQVAMNESKSVFKDIEQQMRVLERDNRSKDRILDQMKQKCTQLSDRNKISEERINSLEKQLTEANGDKSVIQDDINEMRRECDQWKRNYVDASRQLSLLPELEIKLKNSLSTSKDLQQRISDLLSTNEKLKMQINGQQLKDKKLQELQLLYQIVMKENREKTQLIESLSEKVSYTEERLRTVAELQESYSSLEKGLEERTRECKALERKLEEKSILSINYERQLKRLNDDLEKYRERNEKIDHIYKENKRLTNLLMDKINQIEQLQFQLNSHESKMAALSNQKVKVTALYEQCMETVNEVTISLEDSKKQLEVETANRTQLQERCEKLVMETTVLSTALNKEKEQTRSLATERQIQRKEIESLTERLYEEESRFQLFRSESESQISHDRKRIEELVGEVKENKKRLEAMTRKEKEACDQAATLQGHKKDQELKLTTMQQSIQQQQEQLVKMARWKQQYLHFMDSWKGLAVNMQSYCQGQELS